LPQSHNFTQKDNKILKLAIHITQLENMFKYYAIFVLGSHKLGIFLSYKIGKSEP